MGISDLDPDAHGRRPWNAGNMVGAKRPLKPRDVWASLKGPKPLRRFRQGHAAFEERGLYQKW
jgi:hypothetical protein